MTRKLVFGLFVVVLGMSALGGVASAAIVPNDKQENALLIATLPFTDARSTVGARVDPGEPEATCTTGGGVTGASVWYRLIADMDAPLVVSTAGSKFDTVVSVYEAGVGPLTEIACNDDASTTSFQSELKFSALNGSDYYVRVAGYEGAQGYLKLSVDIDPNAFDAFALARRITSLPFSTTVNLSKATAPLELGEPSPCGGYGEGEKTVWFRLTVSEKTGIRAETDWSVDALLTAFEGTSLGSLNYLGCNHSSGAVFRAEPGKVYHLQIAQHRWNPIAGDIPFTVEAFIPPANDDFVDAVELSGVGAKHAISTDGATTEVGEPMAECAYSGATVWYKITPTTTESLVVTSQDSDFDTVLNVYVDDYSGGLRSVACNDEAGLVRSQAFVGWFATAGITYYIQAGGWYGYTGNLAVEIRSGATLEQGYLFSAGASKSDDRFEAGAGAGFFVAGGGVMVGNSPEGELQVRACAAPVLLGICYSSG